MPAETSIPCSKRARDLVREAADKRGKTYDEFLREHFGNNSTN